MMMDNRNECVSSNSEPRSTKSKMKQSKDQTLGDLKLQKGSSGSPIIPSSAKHEKISETASAIEKSSVRSRRHRVYSPSETDDSNENKSGCVKKDAEKSDSKPGPMDYLNSVLNKSSARNTSALPDDQTSCSVGQASPANSFRKKNRNHDTTNHHKPAEVFRKDLISAMKIPDTSQLSSTDYWVLQDSWRMEWEKGVQVPVNPTALPVAHIGTVPKEVRGDYRMPRKMIKSVPDDGDKDTIDLAVIADSKCRYDLDELDVAWLQIHNDERKYKGLEALNECTMEMIMEELETQCHENMQVAIQTKEGLGIEYDENIVCDVCRSPDCEEGNEMVFCDGCNLCVHQACYGILKVPEGSWLCKPCALGVRGTVSCILCGKKGGAMKSTRSGRKWAHVSCALWIPEIHIADPERMEPITKISHIPPSRWSLICNVCKERSVGACIQCSIRHCVTAYHVTCALEMRFDMLTDCQPSESTQGPGDNAVIFRSYCQKHSKSPKKRQDEPPGKKTLEETKTDRQKRIAKLEEEFFSFVTEKAVVGALNVQTDTAFRVMEYWKLKRKANFCRPLLAPKQDAKLLEEAAESGLQRRLRMFTHLRQDLERVRNLCYMIGRREKMKRSSVKNMENVFLAQINYVENRMSHNSSFNPQTLLPSLPRFGSPAVLRLIKDQSTPHRESDDSSPPNLATEPQSQESATGMEKSSKMRRTAGMSGTDMEQNDAYATLPSDSNAKRPKMPIKKIDPDESRKTARKLSISAKSDTAGSDREKGVKSRTTHPVSRRASGNKEPSVIRSSSRFPDKCNTESTGSTSSRKVYSMTSDEGWSKSRKRHASGVSSASEMSGDLSKPGRGKDGLSNAQMKKRKRFQAFRPKPKAGSDPRSAETSSTDNQTPPHSPLYTSRKLQKLTSVPTTKKDKKVSVSEMGMTITTETISETNRISGRQKKALLEKPHSVSGIRSPSISDGITLKTTKTRGKVDASSSRCIKHIESLKKRPPPSSQNSGESIDGCSLGSHENSPRVSPLPPDSKCSSCLSAESDASLTSGELPGNQSVKQAKKGRRASAPLCNCDKNRMCDKFKHSEVDNSTQGQKLEDYTKLPRDSCHEECSCEGSQFIGDKSMVMSHGMNKKKTNISRSVHGESHTMSKRYSKQGLPALTKEHQKLNTGLRWVSLVDDSDHSDREPLGCVRGAVTPKDQEGYRGDMDESDSDMCGTSHQHHCLRHKRSSKKPCFRKHKSCSAVIRIQSSDTSDDDFDSSFLSTCTPGKNLRQKLNSITNLSDGELDQDSIKNHPPDVRKASDASDATNSNKLDHDVGSKNVSAVGGTPGVPKSEPDLWLPPLNSTTDGKNLCSEFYSGFSSSAGKLGRTFQTPVSFEGEMNVLGYRHSLGMSQGLFPFSSDQMRFNNSVFPYCSTGPWTQQLTILPSQYPLPVFYQYPPLPQPYRKNLNGTSGVSSSDSTLQSLQIQNPALVKPIVATSAAAVQTVSFSATNVTAANPIVLSSQTAVSSTANEEDNEWEIVTDDPAPFSEVIDDRHRKRSRKHKKKKKKKRYRSGSSEEKSQSSNDFKMHSSKPRKSTSGAFENMAHESYANQYDCEASSPDNGTVSDATTDMEISTRSPLVIKVTKPKSDRSSVKTPVGSGDSRRSSSLRRRHSRSTEKLILKIDKRAIKFFEEESEEEVKHDRKRRAENLHVQRADDILPSPVANESWINSRTKTSPFKVSGSGDGPNIKLKFKISRPQSSPSAHIKKHKQKSRHLEHTEGSAEYTVLPVIEKQTPQKTPESVARLRKSAPLRRLGLDISSLDNVEEGGGGRRLRERKIKGEEPADDVSSTHTDQKVMRKRKPNGVHKRANSNVARPNIEHRNPPLPSGRDKSSDLAHSKASVSIKSEKTAVGFASLSTGRLEVSRRETKPLHNTLIAKRTKIKQEFCAVTGSSKSLPVFDTLSTKMGDYNFCDQATQAHSITPGAENLSTVPSGHSNLVAYQAGLQPTRHWKKRKVREHETQVFKHQALELGSPPVQSSNPYRDKSLSEESVSTASSQDFDSEKPEDDDVNSQHRKIMKSSSCGKSNGSADTSKTFGKGVGPSQSQEAIKETAHQESTGYAVGSSYWGLATEQPGNETLRSGNHHGRQRYSNLRDLNLV